MPNIKFRASLVAALGLSLGVRIHHAQSLGNSGSLRGSVVDPSGALIASASVRLESRLNSVRRESSSDDGGAFQFNGLPFASYELIVAAAGFQAYSQSISIASAVPMTVKISLSLAGSSTSIQVVEQSAQAIQLSPTAQGTLDKNLLDRLPVQNQATGLSEMVTRSTPGVAADGNGFAHPLGEHADTSIAIDNQPITDQQAKIFSNQLSAAIVETMEVITGAPPAEFGDKTSLIMNVTTQSGLGKQKPSGSISSQYGSFGTWSQGATLGVGSARWGSFTALSSGASGRFLDTPEFLPLHDHGNSQSIFERLDAQPTETDTFHLNLSAARSWFQTPNTFDSQDLGQDQRSQIRSFNRSRLDTPDQSQHALYVQSVYSFRPFAIFPFCKSAF